MFIAERTSTLLDAGVVVTDVTFALLPFNVTLDVAIDAGTDVLLGNIIVISSAISTPSSPSVKLIVYCDVVFTVVGLGVTVAGVTFALFCIV
jgi:hypothetical protein